MALPVWLHVTLRAVFRQSLRVFFRRIELVGEENVPAAGPLLLAPNHPNALIDVLLVACFVDRPLRFVAKSTLIEVPLLGPLLRGLGAVPVHRRDDGREGEEAKRANARVLAECEEVVAAGGAVLIFPEGKSSQDELKLLPLRTGLARIALGAEARAPGRVTVVPVALVYEDPGLFRSAARVRFGAPLQVAAFAATADPADPFPAARALTQAIRDGLELDVLHVDDVANEELVRDLSAIYGDTIESEAGGRLAATKALARAVNAFSASDPERVARVRREIRDYRDALSSAGVTDRAVTQRSPPRPTLGEDLVYVLAAPLAAWGIANHAAFYPIPRLVHQKLGTSREFASTVKLLSGILALVVVYGAQAAVVGWVAGAPVAAGYLASLPMSGLVALIWLEGRERRRRVRAAAALRRGLSREVLADLEARRAAIVRELDRARVAWLASQLA